MSAETPEITRRREIMEEAKVKADACPFGTRRWKTLERAYGDAIIAYGNAVKERPWNSAVGALTVLPTFTLRPEYSMTRPPRIHGYGVFDEFGDLVGVALALDVPAEPLGALEAKNR